jgi:hypothetical protein
MSEKEKDKRAEEQALFMTWLTSLSDKDWESFRDNITYFQDTLSALPVAVAMIMDLEVTLQEIDRGYGRLRAKENSQKYDLEAVSTANASKWESHLHRIRNKKLH